MWSRLLRGALRGRWSNGQSVRSVNRGAPRRKDRASGRQKRLAADNDRKRCHVKGMRMSSTRRSGRPPRGGFRALLVRSRSSDERSGRASKSRRGESEQGHSCFVVGPSIKAGTLSIDRHARLVKRLDSIQRRGRRSGVDCSNAPPSCLQSIPFPQTLISSSFHHSMKAGSSTFRGSHP